MLIGYERLKSITKINTTSSSIKSWIALAVKSYQWSEFNSLHKLTEEFNYDSYRPEGAKSWAHFSYYFLEWGLVVRVTPLLQVLASKLKLHSLDC